MKKILFILLTAVIATVLITAFSGCQAAAVEETTAAAEETTAAAEEKIVIGYASFGDVNPFHAIVSEGYKKEAAARGFELIMVDNNWDSETTVKNVNDLISKEVDIIISGVSDAAVVPAMKEAADEAGIIIVLTDHTYPGLPMYGGNNVTAGGIGGEWLGQMAVETWDGDVDLYIGLEFPAAGEINELRMKDGFIDHAKKHVEIPDDIIYRLAGDNDIALSTQVTLDTLTANPDAEHILIGNLTDDCARGALAAIEQMGLEDNVFICGQGFYDEFSASNFLTPEPTAWGATVTYYPSLYAKTAFDKIEPYLKEGTPLPEAWYVEHELVTRDNVEEIIEKSGFEMPE
jgi:ABC-type sugar transport system substrate-binding protein